jgi:hypothetical protein
MSRNLVVEPLTLYEAWMPHTWNTSRRSVCRHRGVLPVSWEPLRILRRFGLIVLDRSNFFRKEEAGRP